MKKNLTLKETIFVASMLFGMFFGAGNLIFPASMGQLAGGQMWLAVVGFLITGVGLPLLGVAALGISRKAGLLEVSSQVGKRYGICFTSVLYLTIGPFFAIPRCATVAFSVGVEQMFPEHDHTMVLALFSVLFFAVVLFFSLRPGKILVWIGKILNPLFLCFLAILIVRALLSPMGVIGELEPTGAYETQAFLPVCWRGTIQWMRWQVWHSELLSWKSCGDLAWKIPGMWQRIRSKQACSVLF